MGNGTDGSVRAIGDVLRSERRAQTGDRRSELASDDEHSCMFGAECIHSTFEKQQRRFMDRVLNGEYGDDASEHNEQNTKCVMSKVM